MRLIGIGLLVFLLAGLGLSISQSGRLQMVLVGLWSGPLQFETAQDSTEQGSREAAVRRIAPHAPLILSGFPAYQTARFHLPVDARPLSGVLQIDITGQALSGVEGMLRITIANMRRAEILIRPGDLERSVRIELTEQDIAQERLVVSFSLQGAGPLAPCGPDDGIEVIVEIETTSAIFLTLDRALESDLDAVLANGRTAQIALDAEEQELSLLAGAALLRAGLEVEFSQTGLGATEAAALASEFSQDQPQQRFAWSEVMATDSALFGVRSFTRTHSWRIRYDMSQAADRRLPVQFYLAMQLGHLPDQASWQIVVTLNGRMVHEDLAAAGFYENMVALAPEFQSRVSTLEIMLRSTYGAPGECTRPPDLVAELMPQSRLIPGPSQYDGPVVQLLADLASGWSLTAGELTAPEAAHLAGLLASLPTPDGSGPILVRVLPRGTDLSEYRSTASDAQLLLRDAAGGLVIRDLHVIEFRRAGQAMLLIERGPGS